MQKLNQRTTKRRCSLPADACRDKEDMEIMTHAEITDFLVDAGVIPRIIHLGLRKAATEAFARIGYRLATITQEPPGHEQIFTFSCYAFSPDSRRETKVMKKVVAAEVLRFMGVPPNKECFNVKVSGTRLVVWNLMPDWVRDDYCPPSTL